jgi:hypothetical protein
MIRLEMLGPDTRLCSSLCAECPQGPAGCCKSPPPVDWSDIGRIVAGGGRDFLIERMGAKDLIPTARGLTLRRVRRREARTEPLERKCVFHGAGGCTIDAKLRPATCNYFLCDDAFVRGGEHKSDQAAVAARKAHGALRALYERWDEALAARIGAEFPEGPRWDAPFLDWLGDAYRALVGASGAEIAPLSRSA